MAPKGTIVVTGTNGGLGSSIVSRIVSTPEIADNYYGLYTVRKVETATTLNEALRPASASHEHQAIALDLGRLSSVRQVAKDINARVASGQIPPIRALILNAGYQEHTTQDFSEDGFDLSFQANYLGHWLLTLLLLESFDKEDGRIVVVGSWTHDTSDSRNDSMGVYKDEKWKILFHDTESLAKGTFSSLKEDPTALAGMRRYGAGKLCEVMMILELQARLNKDPTLSNISILGVDPGGMATSIVRRASWVMRVVVVGILVPLLSVILSWLQPNGQLRTPAKSAGDVVRAAFDTKTLGQHPKQVYLNGTDPLEPGAEAKDAAKRAMLWRDSIVYAQLKEGETALVNWK